MPSGEPDAGNLHVRFDEGKRRGGVKPSRRFLLYCLRCELSITRTRTRTKRDENDYDYGKRVPIDIA